jgi:hypothetical protein
MFLLEKVTTGGEGLQSGYNFHAVCNYNIASKYIWREINEKV